MKISCIIPAFNEEKSIENTLNVVSSLHNVFHEVIVINDCSTDRTKNIIEKFPNVTLITNQQNLGKSRSVVRGIKTAMGDWIFFLDADLIGLDIRTIMSLIQPIEQGVADVTISSRGNTPKWWMRLAHLEILSGERVVARSVLEPYLSELEQLPGFGIEVFMNKIIIENNLRIKSVIMEHVHNDFKWKKRGLFVGIKSEVFMWKDILKVISPWGFIHQNIMMGKLLVTKNN